MSHAQYGQKGTVQKVWETSATIKGKNPDVYRKDPYGNPLNRDEYGKHTKQGWEIDHIKPKSRDGSDGLRNLQAMQTTKNRSLGNTLCKKSRHH